LCKNRIGIMGIRRINHISASATRYMFLSKLAFRHDIR
jgi:hypothetical protein